MGALKGYKQNFFYCQQRFMVDIMMYKSQGK